MIAGMAGSSLGDKITTLYIPMTEDYSPRIRRGSCFSPPKEKPPAKMIMM
jgi:hypothetical protein